MSTIAVPPEVEKLERSAAQKREKAQKHAAAYEAAQVERDELVGRIAAAEADELEAVREAVARGVSPWADISGPAHKAKRRTEEARTRLETLDRVELAAHRDAATVADLEADAAAVEVAKAKARALDAVEAEAFEECADLFGQFLVAFVVFADAVENREELYDALQADGNGVVAGLDAGALASLSREFAAVTTGSAVPRNAGVLVELFLRATGEHAAGEPALAPAAPLLAGFRDEAARSVSLRLSDVRRSFGGPLLPGAD
jgi:hypothetical protein